MAQRRRRNKEPESVFESLLTLGLFLLVVYGILEYRNNPEAVIKNFLIGFSVVALVLVLALLAVKSFRKAKWRRQQVVSDSVDAAGLGLMVDGWIRTIGRTKEKGNWTCTHRGYVFTDIRVKEFRNVLADKKVIASEDEVCTLLMDRIDAIEKGYAESFAAKKPGSERMSGGDFERQLAQLFEALGYKVQLIGGAGDQGGDLICVRDNTKVLVQAKRWSRPVDNSAVQEAVAARIHYGCDKCTVITNSTFTPGAMELAKTNGVRLVDGKELQVQLAKHLGNKAEPESSQKTCPRCGGKLVHRDGPKGPFWGCENFPTKGCRFMQPI